jgi:hypothetical protein
MADRPSDTIWRSTAGRLLAWLCCALMLVGPGVPALTASAAPPASAALDHEAEEPAPAQDDDDSESGQAGSSLTSRCQRLARRALARRAVPVHWHTHLPHHHGDSLPSCTPFEQGVNLPLRC